jgi:hypothetical protein
VLSNPIYVVEIRHKDLCHPGQHEPILDRNLWERTQQQRRDARDRAASSRVLSNCHRTCPVPAENKTCDTFSTNRSDEPLGVPVYQGEQGAQSADGEYPSFVLRPRLTDRFEGVLKVIKLVEKTGRLRGARCVNASRHR